ncbi:MAG TPA: LytTR family transcriptional regulator DNA-binding domain-containing protein [Desulfobacteria bacterium]|nr:LytTR family transcriptional regulator DNA-binding domain-containing protein [Desulfobacteria bacterium]
MFIVDDEAPARSELKFLLEEIAGVEVVGSARNGQEALAKIPEIIPQVVFLDIELPDMTGLNMAKELVGRMDAPKLPLFVFATAYDEYALKAFDLNAIDYVLKPFSRERLAKAMEKIDRVKGQENAEKDKLDRILALLEKPAARQRLAVEENERIVLLEPGEIVFCNISDRTVKVKTIEREYTTGYSLSELEDGFHFLRTHKSFLVNPEMVREVIPWFNGTMNLVMNDKQKSLVPVSRTYLKEVKNALHI